MSAVGESKGRQVRRLLGSPADLWLLVRMTAWALVLPVLKHATPLPRLARLMWRDGGSQPSEQQVAHLVRLSWLAARFRPLPGKGDNCMERSLVAYRYLSRAGADPRLVVALRRAGSNPDGHVWVTVAGAPVGGEDVTPFTSLFELGPRGERV